VSTAVLDIHVMGSDWIVVGSDDSNRHTSETRRDELDRLSDDSNRHTSETRRAR
jgi:hypothetical protein